MRKVHAFEGAVFALLLVGCGGEGSTGATQGTGGAGGSAGTTSSSSGTTSSSSSSSTTTTSSSSSTTSSSSTSSSSGTTTSSSSGSTSSSSSSSSTSTTSSSSSSGNPGTGCPALCTAAKAGMCTTITGDCTNFCDAVDALTPLAGCTQMKADYLACLGTPATVCQKSCSIQLQDLRACLGSYCAGDPFDADCQTLKNSFN